MSWPIECNVAPMSSLLAGLPAKLPGSTINRLSGPGMDAVGAAACAIRSGEAGLAAKKHGLADHRLFGMRGLPVLG